jgi:hypothetical protein
MRGQDADFAKVKKRPRTFRVARLGSGIGISLGGRVGVLATFGHTTHLSIGPGAAREVVGYGEYEA